MDWQTLGANFFVIFSPGPLDGAPRAYLATARVPPGAGRARPGAVAAAFPNVTAIPVRDVLERVTGVLDRIAVAIRLVALFVLGAGLIVMAEALAQSRAPAALRVGPPPHARRHARPGRARLRRRVRLPRSGGGLGGAAHRRRHAWVVLRFVLDVPPAFEAAPVRPWPSWPASPWRSAWASSGRSGSGRKPRPFCGASSSGPGGAIRRATEAADQASARGCPGCGHAIRQARTEVTALRGDGESRAGHRAPP